MCIRDRFDIEKIRPQLRTERSKAFFWSGRTDGVGGADIAAHIAGEKDGVTLESTIAKKKIVLPEWDFDDPSSMEAWSLASEAYAEQVSGEIRAVIGAELRPGNIWENIELPRLMENLNEMCIRDRVSRCSKRLLVLPARSDSRRRPAQQASRC